MLFFIPPLNLLWGDDILGVFPRRESPLPLHICFGGAVALRRAKPALRRVMDYIILTLALIIDFEQDSTCVTTTGYSTHAFDQAPMSCNNRTLVPL